MEGGVLLEVLMASAKMRVLKRLVEHHRAQGEKVLIFTQQLPVVRTIVLMLRDLGFPDEAVLWVTGGSDGVRQRARRRDF